MYNTSIVTQLSFYFLSILLPILVLYIAYLIVTKAFNDMGFSTVEAIIIVFVSFLLGAGIVDEVLGFNFANIYLFTYKDYWQVGINTGGAIIPIILSIYLTIKNKFDLKKLLVGIAIVSIATYLVTSPDPQKGIISQFPYWIIPILCASLCSIILNWYKKHKAAPFAYASGTIGVLLGADVFHLITLLDYPLQAPKHAVIGGANVFDMVFITGILAVVLDGLFIVTERKK
jgi:uncharacterized membrane protein